MRINGKCNNYHTPSTGLSSILFSVRTQNSRRTKYEKDINTISMQGEKFYQLHTESTIAVVTSKYSGKMDPSEITLFILMNCYIHIGTISMDFFILHHKGLSVKIHVYITRSTSVPEGGFI